MNILVISPWFAPAWKNGGTVTATYQIYSHLSKFINIDVYTTNQNGDGYLKYKSYQIVQMNGLNVRYFNFINKFKGAAWNPKLIVSVIKNFRKYDLIHLHGVRNAYAIILYLLQILFGVKYIITPHAGLMTNWMNTIGMISSKKIYNNIIEKKIFNKSVFMHFLSDYEKDESSPYYDNLNYKIIPNAVDYHKKNSKVYKRLKNKFVLVGRIHPQKGIENSIDFLLHNPKWTLDIIGPVDDYEYFKKIENLIDINKLKNRISFLGYISNSELRLKIKNYDIFLMPSIVEGVSIALLEALSIGLPCITSANIGNFQQIINYNCGWIIKDWKCELKEINNLDKIIFKSNNAKKLIEEKYSLEQVSKAFVEMYKLSIKI